MPINGLSGNEIYCLAQKNYHVDKLVIGNSIYSSGFINNLSHGMGMTVGKEFKEGTRLLSDGRNLAYQRLLEQASVQDGRGIVKLSNELISYPGYLEFRSSGTVVTSEKKSQAFFSTHSDGQECYALLDAGYVPLRVAFGNMVHAMGTSAGLISGLKTLRKGEIHDYTEILNQTRHTVLERVISDAKQDNANALLTIKTIFSPVGKLCEMLLVGTACRNSLLTADPRSEMVTSNLTNVEMWNLAQLGYTPVRMLLNSVVFSLGLSSSVNLGFKSLMGRENNQLSEIISQCREKLIDRMNEEALALKAEMVVGTRIYIFPLGNGLIEFFAMGTAVKKSALVSTESDQLPIQTVITDKYKFFDDTSTLFFDKGNTPVATLRRAVVILVIIIGLVWLAVKH